MAISVELLIPIVKRPVYLRILRLLSKREMYVRELKSSLPNWGRISRRLDELEKMDLIRRERRGKRVYSRLTDEGRKLLEFIDSLDPEKAESLGIRVVAPEHLRESVLDVALGRLEEL